MPARVYIDPMREQASISPPLTLFPANKLRPYLAITIGALPFILPGHTQSPQDELRWAPLHPRAPHTDQAIEAEAKDSHEEPATGAKEAAAASGGGEGLDGERDEGIEFSWGGMEGLAATHDLCATGPAFALALGEEDPAIGRSVAFRLPCARRWRRVRKHDSLRRWFRVYAHLAPSWVYCLPLLLRCVVTKVMALCGGLLTCIASMTVVAANYTNRLQCTPTLLHI